VDRRAYRLLAGFVLLSAAVVFLVLPAVTDLNAFFPVIFSLVAFVAAIGVLLFGD
jgi:hypothetical protein